MSLLRETVESSSEKMDRCTRLALDLAYGELSPDGNYITARSSDVLGELSDEVWGWADGLYQKWYNDRLNGHCSLRATMEFDVEAQDRYMDELIEKFEKLLEKIGKPITLTPEEMTRRGYRGWV